MQDTDSLRAGLGQRSISSGGRYCRFFNNEMESRPTRAETIFDNIGNCRDENRSTFLRSQMGKESESNCLLGQLSIQILMPT